MVRENDSMKNTGESIKKAGTYLPYLITLLEGPKTNSELSKSLGVPASDTSRDVTQLKSASQSLIKVEPIVEENAKGRKLISLTLFGKQIADVALRNIRMNQQLAKLGRMDKELLDFLLERTTSPVAQTRMAAWQGLQSQANRERIWESNEVWELLNVALDKESSRSEFVEYAMRLLHGFAMRAFSPVEDDSTRGFVEEKIHDLVQKHGGEAFWRAIVDESDLLYTQRSELLGTLKCMLKPEAFFYKCWQLWVWRAKRDEDRKSDLDDTHFWITIDPIVIEIQSTPQAIRRKKIEEAFSLTEDKKEFVKERAVRIIRHLLR